MKRVGPTVSTVTILFMQPADDAMRRRPVDGSISLSLVAMGEHENGDRRGHLPEADDLRRRLRAARVLKGVTLRELADLIPPTERLSERTLRAMESEQGPFDARKIRVICEALGMPTAWFMADDLLAVFRNASIPPECDRRLADLERRHGELERAFAEWQRLGSPLPAGQPSNRRRSRPRAAGPDPARSP